MRSTICLSGAIFLLAGICLSTAQEAPTGKRGTVKTGSSAPGNLAKDTEDAGPSNGAKPSPDEPAEKLSPDEEAIRKSAESFLKAYALGDAKSAAEHFTADGEYVDENGNRSTGRHAIEQNFTRFFKENPGAALAVNIESIRFVDPAAAVEDGTATILRRDSASPSTSRYVALHVKSEGKWRVAMVRESTPRGERRHRQQLQQLDWLVGDWVDESDDSIVAFTCRPVDDGHFLMREFTVAVAGETVMSGSQRIGWDPLTGRVRAWTFDSQGGHFEGTWHRDDDTWVLTSTGVTADGQAASGTSVFTIVNSQTIRWQAMDHEVDGVRKPDSELYTLVRVGPAPEAAEQQQKK